MAIAPGTIVDRYRVVSQIGNGSMGDVVRAIDVDLHRPCAIKILSERHRENEELRARFVREARAVAAISHPNVVQVFTTGSFDERPYIAMELLKGVDLGTVVAEHGTMSSIQAARAGLDAARGLEAAAKAGLIHRDVKPSNLVLLESGVVKVTDFGLAKPLDPGDEPALTALGVVVGTPDYIAPEQARGDPIDERVDIYALGGTLYFLACGVPPFRKGNPADDKYLKVVARHLKEPAPDPLARCPSLDPELARLILQMMSKRAVDRPSYAELIEALAGIVDRLQGAGENPSQPVVPIERGSSGPVAPTPYLGGHQRLATSGEPSDPPTPAVAARDSSSVTRHERPGSRGGAVRPASALPAVTPPPDSLPAVAAKAARRAPRAASAPAIQPWESAATPRRASRRVSAPPPKPRVSRWLVAVTVLSALVFATGLGLLLFGPRPQAAAPAPAAAPDAAPAPARPDAAPPPPPTPPEGMALVTGEGGAPLFFIATEPVTHAAFAELFPRQAGKVRRRDRERPIGDVSYAHAASYAQAKGARLPTPDEWQAAAAAGVIEPAEKRWEWVDDGTVGTQAKRAVAAPPDRLQRRRPRGHDDVYFRLARDL